jgi:hypothetical protein
MLAGPRSVELVSPALDESAGLAVVRGVAGERDVRE